MECLVGKSTGNKKIHWHIDYFLQQSKIIDVFYKEDQSRLECNIAQQFSKKLNFIPDFGCSDCRRKSHLFYGSKKEITEIINQLQMQRANT